MLASDSRWSQQGRTVGSEMDQIVDRLYIGSWVDAKKVSQDNSFYIITVAEDAPFQGNIWFPLSDPGKNETDHKNFLMAVATTINYITRSDKNVLVHCVSGVNRSASVVIAAIVLMNGVSIQEAYQKVFEKRKLIRPCRGMLRLIRHMTGKKFENEERYQFVPDLDSEEKIVNDVYMQILGRKADPDGLYNYSMTMKAGHITKDKLIAALQKSDEYQHRNK